MDGLAKKSNRSRIWLSYPLTADTPQYGGSGDLAITSNVVLREGQSCQTSHLQLPSHAGTHVDAPRHFIEQGDSVDLYPPDAWFFESPLLLNVPVASAHLIQLEELPLAGIETAQVDLLLLRTGFESVRQTPVYWKAGPGVSEALAISLRSLFPKLRGLGVDAISISSFEHREEGRRAHRVLLGEGILLFEDLSLQKISSKERLQRVMAFPLRFLHADGAPCTIVAEVVEDGSLSL